MSKGAVKTSPQAPAASGRPAPQKFYGKCILKNWSAVSLVVKATSEDEAIEKLHQGYAIRMVVDILTEEQHQRTRINTRRSFIGGSGILTVGSRSYTR